MEKHIKYGKLFSQFLRTMARRQGTYATARWAAKRSIPIETVLEALGVVKTV